MNEYILVEFDEIREVIIDETASGYNTGEVIELGAGTHTIGLDGLKNFSPIDQDVDPSGTTPIQPQIIYFYKVSDTWKEYK
jgi:hypothetical protein